MIKKRVRDIWRRSETAVDVPYEGENGQEL
jgi:hypothetical protein